ncbi:MAG: PepSY domain-containing protein [Oligoflexia bacterium]|nr:PepSY domain-containing protein [Oligoflexia bacterium]
MKLKLLVRKTHKWLSLVVAAQLFLWTLSGLIFSLLPMDRVHGDHLVHPGGTPGFAPGFVPYPLERLVSDLGRRAPGSNAAPYSEIRLRVLLGQPIYEVTAADGGSRLFDASSGRPLELGRARIIEIAKGDFSGDGSIVAVELLEKSAPIEFRGKLPVWKVAFDNPEKSHLYISPHTGKVLARRSEIWRLYDFFWMLHIMDYEERESFNHPLLITSAALGLLTSLSGVALLFVAFPRRRAKHSR